MKRLRRLFPELMASGLTAAGVLLVQHGEAFWGNWAGFLGVPFWWYFAVYRDRQYGTIVVHSIFALIWGSGVLDLYL
jgi:hypothetical protein